MTPVLTDRLRALAARPLTEAQLLQRQYEASRLETEAGRLRNDAYLAWLDGRKKRSRELNGKADALFHKAQRLTRKVVRS